MILKAVMLQQIHRLTAANAITSNGSSFSFIFIQNGTGAIS
jgi:hypothetical protein